MTQASPAPKGLLKTRFLSHGTLGSLDLEKSRRFYEEFLGVETVRTAPNSLMIRLGGDHVYAVILLKKKGPMDRFSHNGLDVDTDADVDAAHALCLVQAEQWGLHDISKPVAAHGTYSFHFWDADDNCWEILSNPQGGYRWIFDQGDLSGKGHMEKNFRLKRQDRQRTS